MDRSALLYQDPAGVLLMLATSTCPSKKELRDYLVGQLPDSESSLVEEHLRNCRCCEGIVDKLDSSSLAKDEPDVLLNFLPQAGLFEQEQDQLDAASKENLESGGNPDKLRPEDSWEDLANRKLSSYELVQRIGAGGMGMVYRARHRSLDKWVAVKLLPARRGADATAVGRFQREMRLVGRLNHPAIVSATDAGLDGGTHFLVMELIDGLDLSRIVRAVGQIAPADVAEIGRQVALGLDHAHAQGVIHRDIKPSNLMLDGQGQVKLLDLGLADLCPWCQPVDDWTTVGQLLGTLDYMAPEQADGQRGVTHRSDLYSLGATMFRLVAGRPPLAPTPDGSPLEKLRLLATERPPAVRTLRPDLPIEFARIIDQLLDRDPARRPSSAAAIAEQLEPLTASADLRALIDAARQKLHDQAGDPVRGELNEHNVPDWPPNVALASSPESAMPIPGTEIPDKKSSGWIRGGWRVLATLLAAAGGAMVLGTILIVLETMQGQLVIETDQADLRVRVVADGEPVRHLELKSGATSTRLRADKYEIIIDQPVDRTVMIENGSFELRRGETVIARIRSQLRGDVPDATAAAGAVGRGPRGVVYEGRTTNQWIDDLRYERSAATIQNAVRALLALRPQEGEEEIVELVLDAVRRHGVSTLNKNETPDGAQHSYVQQLLASVSPPPELVDRLLRDMAERKDPQADRYGQLVLALLPYVRSDEDLIRVSRTLVEVMPAMPAVAQKQPNTVVFLGPRLADQLTEQLTPEREELADQVMNATFQAFRKHDVRLFGNLPRTDRERDSLPSVRRRYIIADNLRFALEKANYDAPHQWIPLVESVLHEPKDFAHLERLIPNFQRRMLDRIWEVVASPEQRMASIESDFWRSVAGSPIERNELLMGLARLSQAGSESKIDVSFSGLIRQVDAFHYLLILLERLGRADEEVLDWLRARQGEVKEAHDRVVELAPIMSEFHEALVPKLPEIGSDRGGRVMLSRGAAVTFPYRAPLSYAGMLSLSSDRNLWERFVETDGQDRSPQHAAFMNWFNTTDIEPLDPEVAKSFRDNLFGYWDYILITGAIHLLTGGEDIAESRERTAEIERDSAADTPPMPPSASEAVYEGRTARQWMDELRRERSVAKIQEGMAALLALQPKDAEEEIVEWVLEAVRRHGVRTLNRRPDGTGGSHAIVERLVSSVTSPLEFSQRALRDMAVATDPSVVGYAGLVELVTARLETLEDREALAETYLEVLPELSQPPEIVGSLAQTLAGQLVADREPLATSLLDATFRRFHDHRGNLFGSLPRSREPAHRAPPLPIVRYRIADQFRFIPERQTGSIPQDGRIPQQVTELLYVLDFLDEHPEEVEPLRRLVPGFLAHVLERGWGIMDDVVDGRQEMLLRSAINAVFRQRGQTDLSHIFEPLTKLVTASGLDVELEIEHSPRKPLYSAREPLDWRHLQLRHHVLSVVARVAGSDEELLAWLRARQEKTRASYEGFVEFIDMVFAWERDRAGGGPNADRPDVRSVRESLGSYSRLSGRWLFQQGGPQLAPQVAERYEQLGIQPLAPELWKAAGENFPGYWDYILITGAINKLTSDAESVP